MTTVRVRVYVACVVVRQDNYPFQSTLQAFYCGKDQYNEMATFFFNPAEMAIKQLFHFEGVDAFSNMNLAIFWLVYTLFTAITYGTEHIPMTAHTPVAAQAL